MKTYFFGWESFKWFVREVRKIYSNEKSYFSKKRMESGACFTAFMWGMVAYFIVHVGKMSVTDLLIWASPLLLICGYNIREIQKEKNAKTITDNNNTES